MRHSFTDRDGVMVGIDGDVANAASLLSFAKGRIISMRELFGNDSIHSNSFLINGSVVFCKIDNEKSWVFIQGAGGSAEFLHGYVNGGNIVGQSEEGIIKSLPEPGYSAKLQSFYPSSDQATFEGLETRAYRLETDLAMPVPAELNVFTSENVRMAQSGAIQPSLYSGKMRKVVQVLLGKIDYEMEYRWGFYKTDGIITDLKGNPWLVRIANGVGVVITQLDTEKYTYGTDASLDLIYDALGYVPTGEGFPGKPASFQAAIASGSVKRVLEQHLLNQFYTKQPFYDDCGWCFSDNGHFAQNTCWAYEGDFRKAYRYKISFEFDDETGRPVSASISMVESDWMFTNTVQSRFQVPVSSNGLDLKTFPMHPNPLNLTPPASSFNAPIHVWYDGDSEKVLRYKGGTSGTSTHYKHEVVPGSSIDSRGPVIPNDGSRGYWYSGPIAGGVRLPMTSGACVSFMDNGGASAFFVTGFDIPDFGSFDYFYTSGGMIMASMSIGGGEGLELGVSGFNQYAYTQDSGGTMRKETRTNAIAMRQSSVAISPRDRSGIFFTDKKSDTWSNNTTVVAKAGAATVRASLRWIGPSPVNEPIHPPNNYNCMEGAASNFSSIYRVGSYFDGGAGHSSYGYYYIRGPFWLFYTSIVRTDNGVPNYYDDDTIGLHVHDVPATGDGQSYDLADVGSYVSTTTGVGGEEQKDFYFLSDRTGLVNTGYSGILIDDYPDLYPDPISELYLAQYSSHSYIKGSSLFSAEPFGVSGGALMSIKADAEPLEGASSRSSWVGAS